MTGRRDRRAVVAGAAVVAVVVTALAVGGGPDAPEQPGSAVAPAAPEETPGPSSSGTAGTFVSEDDFCAAFGRLARAREAHLRGASTRTIATLRSSATEVGELLPGAAMEDSVKAGADDVVEALAGLPDGATAQDVVDAETGDSPAARARADAFAAWLGDACDTSLPQAR